MARKINTKEQRQPRTLVVGAGITEYWYLKHLKKHMGFKYILKPSLFGDESMTTIQNRICEGLDSGSIVVCVFDEDVRQWNETERKRMDEISQKYIDNKNVILAGNMPSIEYWLLLHFENTCRYFGTSSKVIGVLRKYIGGFDKKEHFLKQDKWLLDLLKDNKMMKAYSRAKIFRRDGQSYSDMWKAIDAFEDEM